MLFMTGLPTYRFTNTAVSPSLSLSSVSFSTCLLRLDRAENHPLSCLGSARLAVQLHMEDKLDDSPSPSFRLSILLQFYSPSLTIICQSALTLRCFVVSSWKRDRYRHLTHLDPSISHLNLIHTLLDCAIPQYSSTYLSAHP